MCLGYQIPVIAEGQQIVLQLGIHVKDVQYPPAVFGSYPDIKGVEVLFLMPHRMPLGEVGEVFVIINHRNQMIFTYHI